jgi:triosephosphate isomerase
MAKSRKYLIAGNWKMNVPSSDATQLIGDIVARVGRVPRVDVLVCPPFTSLAAAHHALAETDGIFLGAQNFYPERSGAYTGEVSPAMLRELGVSHAIVGHSERRAYFGETDEFINGKVRCALVNSLIPILCVGEILKYRREGKELATVEGQIRGGLADVTPSEAKKVIVAYEPVWAIGTGETATPEIAQSMHAFIRGLVGEMFDGKTAATVRILYGGSMKADNAGDLMGAPDIDGGLIGGASLKASSFVDIIKIAATLTK